MKCGPLRSRADAEADTDGLVVADIGWGKLNAGHVLEVSVPFAEGIILFRRFSSFRLALGSRRADERLLLVKEEACSRIRQRYATSRHGLARCLRGKDCHIELLEQSIDIVCAECFDAYVRRQVNRQGFQVFTCDSVSLLCHTSTPHIPYVSKDFWNRPKRSNLLA